MAALNSAVIYCKNGVFSSTQPLTFLSTTSSHRHHSSFSPVSSSCFVSQRTQHLRICSKTPSRRNTKPKGLRVDCSLSGEPLKVMISGAPASGKGTQCEMIVQKYGLVHISTGDLLRAEVSSGSEIGNKAKECMESGCLVPDEIVTAMVTSRLSREDAKEKGWLLDGYPRSSVQAQSLERLMIRPDIYIILDVPDEILVDRCIGRRLDPLTGKIYHLKNFPPETVDIQERLITRSDDTQEKVKSRLETYKENAEAISSTYLDILNKIDANHPKEVVFQEIDSLLSQVQKNKVKMATLGQLESTLQMASSSQDNWRGIPTRLNNIPHSREIRKYFYDDVLQATGRAVADGRTRLKVEIAIPELNPEMDVYRIGTLMELVRVLALSFADDGKRVKVCVQGSMGEGALAGMPLQLAGTRKILEFMDWGDYGAVGTFINIGSIGAREVDEQNDIYILVAPQNAVGNCIIDDMKAMTDAAGKCPVILVNPRLKDLPGSSGIMQTMGRDKRLEYAASFENCYSFRLLYYAGTQYPIMGALRLRRVVLLELGYKNTVSNYGTRLRLREENRRLLMLRSSIMAYPYRYELYKRTDESLGKEKYTILATFLKKPNVDEINDAFDGKPRTQKKPSGIWNACAIGNESKLELGREEVLSI